MVHQMVSDAKVPQVWDTKMQAYHGGQDWKFCSNFVSDFSVTTNALGTPASGMKAAENSLRLMEHYPAADFEPAKTDLAKFLCPEDYEEIHSRLLLGNGASELIDLVTRLAPSGGFKPGSRVTQYKEYERSAKSNGRKVLSYQSPEPASITAIINPCNPTGEWRDLEDMKAFILERCTPGTVLLVDESMQPWIGPDWRDHSLLSAREFLADLHNNKNISVYIIHSWTKLWSCPGIRLGSIIAPTAEALLPLKEIQVPWSVNVCALAFLSAVTKDDEYLRMTWSVTEQWRERMLDFFETTFPAWRVEGESWLSWLWIDTGDATMAEKVVQVCRANGTPCRSGAPGYSLPTYVRFGVRGIEEQDALFQGLLTLLPN
eukprot:TRINITY_DN2543_c0_g1::TRINITY_DN2543_c0_g1_i1::g.19474::m.19474 TRINITY_DN2543_c0_g1::TRINITY_DN2543_c0_g1_i1::g.19474  ORF type:complete len:391 (-),score=86.23,sp/Q8R5U4/COBD_CALS4/26.26/3e-16,Aminotran_1_2/PF00155.16/3.8e-08,YjbR/PF04237.8/0.1 TRINITY_DN2543_c0_g1_i1:392-1513(-)